MSDELTTPLGRKKLWDRLPRPAAHPADWPFGRLMLGAVVLILGVFVLRIVLVDDPGGGRPTAEVPIDNASSTNDVADAVGAPSFTVGEEFPAAGADTVADEEPEPASPAPVPDLADRERNAFGTYPDLIEETQHGAIPRIGPNGERPFDAYARLSISPASANGRPLVAIVMTGLGLGAAGTADAIAKLPDNVTLAFAPYGDSLATAVETARAEGHELWLEIPMEPFDYPSSDPGPHTLLTGQPARANLDKLYWLMARFGGYAGILNNQGARFTSSADDFGPVMEELGTRGLGYLDDGSSNRSQARRLADTNRVPFARAGVALDTNPSRPAILEALEALVARAREDGVAAGTISALPVSIDTVASWAAAMDDGDVALVPVSALMQPE